MVDAVETRVRFVSLTEDEIEDYVASGEPMDKAGAYAIQGLASKFIDRIEGDYFNVVGLPVHACLRNVEAIHAGAHLGMLDLAPGSVPASNRQTGPARPSWKAGLGEPAPNRRTA